MKSKAPTSIKITQSEIQLIKQTLQETRGNKTEAAKLLGIPRRTFYRKLEKLKEIEN